MARFMYILKLAGEGGEVPPREFRQDQISVLFPFKTPATLSLEEAQALVNYWTILGKGLAVYTLVEES